MQRDQFAPVSSRTQIVGLPGSSREFIVQLHELVTPARYPQLFRRQLRPILFLHLPVGSRNILSILDSETRANSPSCPHAIAAGKWSGSTGIYVPLRVGPATIPGSFLDERKLKHDKYKSQNQQRASRATTDAQMAFSGSPRHRIVESG